VFVVFAVMGLLGIATAKVPAIAPIGRWQLVPYVIGCVAAFWTIERTISFL
jgi:hypothetical protein